MTWNTNMIFASIVCQYQTATSDTNIVTVWDQRILRTDTDHWLIDVTNEHVEYYLTDMNKELKDTNVKIFFRWELMSTIGTYWGDMVEVGQF